MTYQAGPIPSESLEELKRGIESELQRIADELEGIDCSGGLVSFQGRINWKKIAADSIAVEGGSVGAFTVADLQTANDGNILDFAEAAGSTNSLIVDFVGVKAFNLLRCLASYEGSTSHAIHVMLYNWQDAAWEGFACMQSYFTNSGALVCNHDSMIPNSHYYVGRGNDEGKVRVKFLHVGSPNNAHNWYFDEVALYL